MSFSKTKGWIEMKFKGKEELVNAFKIYLPYFKQYIA